MTEELIILAASGICRVVLLSSALSPKLSSSESSISDRLVDCWLNALDVLLDDANVLGDGLVGVRICEALEDSVEYDEGVVGVGYADFGSELGGGEIKEATKVC